MKYPKAVAGAIAVGALAVGVGVGAGVSGGHTTTTVTHTVAGPTRTVIRDVPGPTVTHTVTVPAPQPTEGATIATFHGSGNEVTHEFNVPSDGNYIVSWQYSNNSDSSGAADFIVSTTGSDDDATGLANQFESNSGHGSGEVQDAGSSDSLTVQADDNASWTLTVTAA